MICVLSPDSDVIILMCGALLDIQKTKIHLVTIVTKDDSVANYFKHSKKTGKHIVDQHMTNNKFF